MAERIVPTAPGWWWRREAGGEAWPVLVEYLNADCVLWWWDGDGHDVVQDDGAWLAPVATPEQVAAMTAERDDLAAELAAARGEDIGEWAADIEAVDSVTRAACGVGVRAPLIAMGKAQVVREALRLGIQRSDSVSCYQPSNGGAACGSCASCVQADAAWRP